MLGFKRIFPPIMAAFAWAADESRVSRARYAVASLVTMVMEAEVVIDGDILVVTLQCGR